MKKLLILFLFVGVFAGCKDDVVSPDDKEKEQPESTEMTDFQIVDLCYKNQVNVTPRTFVITTDSAYRAIFDGRNCDSTLPDINFSKRTLLSYNIHTGRMEPEISFKGQRNDSLKQYSIVVQIKERNFDLVASSHRVWFTVPKINSAYTVSMIQEKLGVITWEPSTYEIIPSGTTKNLYSVSFGDSLTGYAAGEGGTLLKTSNGGASWNILSSGTTANLRGIFAVSPTIVYVCGTGGTILKSANGGATWTIQTSSTDIPLNSLHFIDGQNGFAVGGDMVNNSTRGIILKTTNGGATWNKYSSQQNLPLLNSVSMRTASTGVAVGQSFENGVVNSMSIVQTNNGGASWEVINSNVMTILYDICFLDTAAAQVKEPYGCIVGEKGVFLGTEDSGRSWRKIDVRTTDDLLSIKNANSSSEMFFAGTANGNIQRSVDWGHSWFPEKTGTSHKIYDIANTKIRVWNNAPSFAVGANGTIIKINHGRW